MSQLRKNNIVPTNKPSTKPHGKCVRNSIKFAEQFRNKIYSDEFSDSVLNQNNLSLLECKQTGFDLQLICRDRYETILCPIRLRPIQIVILQCSRCANNMSCARRSNAQ